MNLTPKILSIGLAVLGLAAASVSAAPLRVLYFTKSAGYEHSVIKQVDGARSFSENLLTKWGPTHDMVFTFSKDGSKFSKAYLEQFDVIVFYTSGHLLSVGTDGHPAMTPEGKQALLDAIAGGKGFVGLHSCSDTFHTYESGGGNNPHREMRYKTHGEASDPFIRMLGGEFIRHGPQQVAKAKVIDPKFPGFEKLGSELNVNEEWYTLKDFAPDIHVLLVMQTAGMDGFDYQRPNFPLAWARNHGKGRVAYNAMGHREDVWESDAFQSMLIGSIKWAGGLVKADVSPNLEKVTPEHGKFQPMPPPTPAKKE